ncbi:MAG: hypothetical protein ABIQ63_07495 [Rhodanobacter sp.]
MTGADFLVAAGLVFAVALPLPLPAAGAGADLPCVGLAAPLRAAADFFVTGLVAALGATFLGATFLVALFVVATFLVATFLVETFFVADGAPRLAAAFAPGAAAPRTGFAAPLAWLVERLATAVDFTLAVAEVCVLPAPFF